MTEISHHTVRVNDIRLHYLMAGEGAPVVLPPAASKAFAMRLALRRRGVR
jgi:hypothetical protein